MTKYTLYTIGGIHSVSSAKDADEKMERERPSNLIPDPRWKNFPTKIYLFEESWEEVLELIHYIAIEDNRSYKQVRL